MKKNKNNGENYLERVPCRNSDLGWEIDDSGIVTLSKKNKGLFNFLAQKLLKKPKVSYIHLDEFGSFVWLNTDGESDIVAIGQLVKQHFGAKAEPLYERLAKFYQILSGYGFVIFKK